MFARRRDGTILHQWITRFALCVALLLGSFPSDSAAGTRRHDVPDSQFLDLASSNSAFDAVGKFNWSEPDGSFLASGVLVESNWVLTAAHVIDGTDFLGSGITNLRFQIDGETIDAAQWIPHENWEVVGGNLFAGWDIGLVRLDRRVINVDPVVRFIDQGLPGQPSELGQTATMVGFGTTGTGVTGFVSGTGGTKRAGQNIVDVVGDIQTAGSIPNFRFGNDRLIAADFDEPGTPASSTLGNTVPIGLEYLTAPGDSGGGLFLQEAGIQKLAGITSIGTASDGNINSDYKDRGSYTRVSRFNDWIEQTIAANSPVLSAADFDADGDVDGDDLALWQNGFGTLSGATEVDGDADLDGDVDGADFLTWQQQLGSTAPSLASSQAVSEPATAMMLILATPLLLIYRTRHPRSN